MFLFHLSPEDNYILDFIETYNRCYTSFEFTTYIIIENNDELINNILNRKLNKQNVYIFAYNGPDELIQIVNRINFKYVFYTLKYLDFWSKINYFNKYLIYSESQIESESVKSKESHKIYLDDANLFEKGERQNIKMSKNVPEKDIHKFFRCILADFQSTCMINGKNMIVYTGTNNLPVAAYETSSLVSKDVELEDEPKEDVNAISDVVKRVNGLYKCHESKHTKNIEIDTINICIIGDWIKSEELQKLWIRYCKEGNSWDNLRLVDENHPDIDYYVIINRANFSRDVSIPSDKCIVFHMEPNMIFTPWYIEFLSYFSSMDLLYNGKHFYHKNNIDWHLSLSYSELDNLKVEKTKGNALSMVMSSRLDNIGHIMRIRLAYEIDRCNNIKTDIYGKCQSMNFINYKGELPYYCRDSALIPYKYHFMAENTSIDNYFSEKIIDCILAETLCFYWGCPTLERFIDNRCFIRLPLHDTEKSLAIIKESIANDEWSKRIDVIRRERMKILNLYSLMPRVKNILRLNTNYQILFIGNKPQEVVDPFVNRIMEQSFKNVSYKKLNSNVLDGTSLYELISYVSYTKQNYVVIHIDNCFVNDRIDVMLHDKICDTMNFIYNQKLEDNLVFLFNNEVDINNIFKQDIMLTASIADKIVEVANNNKFTNILELLSNIPLIRLRYIF